MNRVNVICGYTGVDNAEAPVDEFALLDQVPR
jgi:hypothetical protein